MMADRNPTPMTKTRLTCRKCAKPESSKNILQRCGRCKTASYCSRDCQKEDWKEHKTSCLRTRKSISSTGATTHSETTPAAMSRPSPPDYNVLNVQSGLGVGITTPFTQLAAHRWLHGRTKTDVFKLLIDTIYVRSWDDQILAAQNRLDTVQKNKYYAARMLIVRFLKEAEGQGLLPPWWSVEKEQECVDFGLGEGSWKGRDVPIQKYQVLETY